jgi:hypothetical protein
MTIKHRIGQHRETGFTEEGWDHGPTSSSKNQGENETNAASKDNKVMNCWPIPAMMPSIPSRAVVWRRARSSLS